MMKKKELLEKIKSFDDDSYVVFITNYAELLDLDSEGVNVEKAIEVSNGAKKVIALMG